MPGLRVALLIVSAAVLQLGVLAQLRINGVAGDLLMVVAISGGLVAGERRGAVTGFFAGLIADLMMPSRPLGLSALTFAIVGYLTGRYQSTVVRSSRMLPVSISVIATAGGGVGYVLFARLLSGLNLVDAELPLTLVIMSLFSAVLILPIRALMRWAWDEEVDYRARVR